jgi:tetratricopeptide (TPR) repeat protein
MSPRAVVIPFGVPTEGRGLGLGLAALVHTCVNLEGGGVAIAQLCARRKDETSDAPPAPVEAFVPPAAWKDIAGRGEAPTGISVVVTGAFEPPSEGVGALELLAFDPCDGRTRARVDAPLDSTHAGASLVGALEQLGARLGGQLGPVEMLRELDWESLESVLRAERCALHDPARGGPHDRLAAMLHLGRAIGDSPSARYPVERLASIALQTAMVPALDPRLAAAAARALSRAVEDVQGCAPARAAGPGEGHDSRAVGAMETPAQVELLEALGSLLLRVGQAAEAERRLNAALALAPTRARLYAFLAQALRMQGQLDAALAALEAGAARAGSDPWILSERGATLAARGDSIGAMAAWREALARDPVYPSAFANLAAFALRVGDALTAQSLVDAALVAPMVHPEVLRRAIQLALASEREGIARASRVARLCERMLDSMPDEPWALLVLAKSWVVLGDVTAARAALARVERLAPQTAAAAEAQAARFALDEPAAELEVQSVLRAARTASTEHLAEVAARARRVATLHASWPAWLAAATAERRRARWAISRSALEVALELAPGAPILHLELAEVLLALDEAAGSVEHVERVVALEGESPRALIALARGLVRLGRLAEAREAALRALGMRPESEEVRALLETLRPSTAQQSWLARLRGVLRRSPT